VRIIHCADATDAATRAPSNIVTVKIDKTAPTLNPVGIQIQ
jgi:hypothetical protein